MRDLEELLQERLEQLETGEPLEACLADLSADEAELLELAVKLGQVRYPERDSDVVAAQRAQLLSLSKKEQSMKTRSSSEKAPLRSRPGWLRPLVAFSGAVALLFVCGLVALVGLNVVERSSRDTEVLQAPGPDLTQDPAPGATSESTYTLFFPAVSAPDVRNPEHAALRDVQGLVQVRADDGTWTVASARHALIAGQRIRTGALSSARLVFYDGSWAYLGPDTEVAVDELDARLSGGPRVVALTQWRGETEHDVVPAQDGGSRYEVRTPSGTGTAKGTAFQVLVTPDQGTRFSVDEGAVAVTSEEVTVVVVAGQLTTVNAGQAPAEPSFRITGEGRVSQIGPVWIIAGQPFQTHDGTVIVGNPQVGDWVFVDGHLLPDDTRIADWIVLLRRSPANRFTITGRVEAIGDTEWTVAGQTIVVDDETDVEDDVEIGALVRVEGVILEGGTLVAASIHLIEDEPGGPFEFIGVVQDVTDQTWTISGVAITVDDDTEIDEDIAVGDVVQVSGWILEDGSWLARSIERVAENEREFEFTGLVESIDPWVVAGIPFETDEWTEIEAGIEVGDRVRVEGYILEDGTWMATAVERLEDDDDEVLRIVFVGTVTSTDPWVVSGLPLVVDDETVIEGDVEVGDLVRVEVTILTDGTWLVTRITLLSEDEPGLGCLYISAVVVGVDGDRIELLGWPVIFLDDIPVTGEIRVGSVILMLVCVDEDGTIHIVSITVIYQPEPEVPPPPPPPPDDEDDDEGGKVTICHKPNSKNPRTITISRSALPAHLGHGDTIGPCP